MKASMLLADEASLTEDRLHGNVIFAGAVGVDPEASVGAAITAAMIEANKAAANAAYAGGLNDLESISSSANAFMLERTSQAGATDVELSFDVSSPEPLDDAYIVVIANYAADNKSGKVAQKVSARAFDRLDSQTRKVTMVHAAKLDGLPFKNFDIGLYSNGQEVATNLSSKRVDLTREQAYEFFLIDYLTGHKDATRPPTPILMAPRAVIRRQIGDADANQPVYATIDKMGKILSISADEAGKVKLPASVEVVMQNVRFMPALNKGDPVEGRVKITLADLAG
jgi:hypothetical protein